jgi:uncharacterized NAD(P)/FAD-binding protein YdhS
LIRVGQSHVFIVGGGLSGSLTAIQLLRRYPKITVAIAEKEFVRLGRGIAYQTSFQQQLLNVPVGAMSAFPDEPDHFLLWLNQNKAHYTNLIPTVDQRSFIPRAIYGDYLSALLLDQQKESPDRLIFVAEEIRAAETKNQAWELLLSSGKKWMAHELVLAMGNAPPADLFEDNFNVLQSPFYSGNPWTENVLGQLNGHENILLVGSGLTAIDLVLGLNQQAFSGQITMLSRNGKLPLPHQQTTALEEIEFPSKGSPLFWFKWARALSSKYNHQTLADLIRPHLAQIWMNWDTEEKKQFIRHVRPFWEMMRHRIPPESDQVIQQLIRKGQLQIRKARLEKATVLDNGISVEWNEKQMPCKGVFQKLINCTGPQSNYRKLRSPLLQSLLDQGITMLDEIGLGILCTPEGQLINRSGSLQEKIHCIGPMLKAVRWETTAVREIREQAFMLAQKIGNSHSV